MRPLPLVFFASALLGVSSLGATLESPSNDRKLVVENFKPAQCNDGSGVMPNDLGPIPSETRDSIDAACDGALPSCLLPPHVERSWGVQDLDSILARNNHRIVSDRNFLSFSASLARG